MLELERLMNQTVKVNLSALLEVGDTVQYTFRLEPRVGIIVKITATRALVRSSAGSLTWQPLYALEVAQ